MGRPWQSVELGGPWKGLFARRWDLIEVPLYAGICEEVSFFGGALQRRGGTRIVNGASTLVTTGSSTTVIKCQEVSTFLVGDVVNVVSTQFGGVASSSTVTIVTDGGFGSRTLTVSPALSFTPGENAVVWTKRVITSLIDELFQAIFRDGTRVLLAVAGGVIFAGTATPVAVTEGFPVTTVDVTWGGTATGTLTSVQGLQVGDWIRIAGAGAAGGTLITQVTALTASTRTIVISPVATSAPAATAVVTFFPIRAAGETHFLQYANLTHIVAKRPLPGVPVGVSNPPIKYTGTVLRRHGVRPPVTAPTAADAGAGAGPNGAYTYRLKFRNSATGAESEPSPISNSVTVVDNDITLTTLAVSVDPQVDVKDIYRTTAGGAGVWFYVGTVTNATTGFTDSLADSELGRQMREFLDTTIPDGVDFITLWAQANRLVAIDRTANAVIFSDQPDIETGFLKGEAWPVDNQIFVSYDDGDELVAIASFFDSLFVFKRRSIWRITGIPPDIHIEPVVYRADQTGLGLLSSRGLAVDANEMIFPSMDGLLRLSRYASDALAFETQRLSEVIDDLWLLVRNGSVTVHAVYNRVFRQYRLFGGQGGPAGAFVLQFGNMAPGGEALSWATWSPRRFSAGALVGTVMTASVMVRDGQQFAPTPQDACYVGCNDGLILEMDVLLPGSSTTLAVGILLGIPIALLYKSLAFSPAGPGIPARGRALDVMFSASDPVSVDFTPETEFNLAGVPLSLPMALGSGGTARLIFLTRGRMHQLRIAETPGSTVVVFPSIQRLVYWFQELPPAAATVASVQSSISYPTT